MLVKWIRCGVEPELTRSFSLSQTAWSRLRAIDGFRGQIGGWDASTGTEACILGFWSGRRSYGVFMEDLHDDIASRTGQEATYRSIDVSLYDVLMEIPSLETGVDSRWKNGEILSPSLDGQAGDPRMQFSSRVVRVGELELKPGRREHFLECQSRIWNPGMGDAPGMHGGFLGRAVEGDDRYLVVSFWESEAAHRAYVGERLPGLRDRSEIDLSVASSRGWIILREDSWTVLPEV